MVKKNFTGNLINKRKKKKFTINTCKIINLNM